jgi:DNA-binding FrmR family transcriptional regulator
MSHIADDRKTLVRVRKIKGQAIALENALISDTDCVKILQQISAVKGAVNGLMKEVLEGHLRAHLAVDGLSDIERKDEVEEVIMILKSYLK